jgi:putative transposase
MKYRDKKQYRHKEYDYSQNGFYFVTICTKDRELFFGDAVDCKIKLSKIGIIANKFWREIPSHFPFAKLDEFIIMPNHIHGIIQIDKQIMKIVGTQDFAFPQNNNENKFGPQSKNLSSIIRGFKIGVTKFAKNNDIEFAWQSRFHDRIIRDEDELNRIREYIIDNPLRWKSDRNNLEDLYM